MFKKFWFCFLGATNICLFSCVTRQNLDNPEKTHFLKFYGKDGDQTGKDLVILQDGNFMLFGTSKLTGENRNSQWYLVKVDPKGYVIWEKTFGGLYEETASDIELTDNGVVLVGNSFNETGFSKVFVMTLTFEGVEINRAVIGLETPINPQTNEDAKSVTVIPNGFLIAGSTTSTGLKSNAPSIIDNQGNNAVDIMDAFHLRLNSDLTEYPAQLWTKTHGPGSVDVGIKILPGNSAIFPFYFFGYSNKTGFLGQSTSRTDFNFWYFGLNEFGESSGDFHLGDFTTIEKLASVSVSLTRPEEGFILGGFTSETVNAGSSYFFISKVINDLSFNKSDEQFETTLQYPIAGGTNSNMAILVSNFGGFWVLGNEPSFAEIQKQNWILIRLDGNGKTVWNYPLVFGGEGLDICGGIQELSDGHLLIIGSMRTGKPEVGEYKMTLIKVNSDGLLF